MVRSPSKVVSLEEDVKRAMHAPFWADSINYINDVQPLFVGRPQDRVHFSIFLSNPDQATPAGAYPASRLAYAATRREMRIRYDRPKAGLRWQD